jgi:copper homeostasis protein
MAGKFSLEICAYNIQSCIIAEKAGADRVELCNNHHEGGTTPSYGVIKQAREKISIPLYPIIRPRAGNFYYDENEIEVIRRDIAVCKDLGCNGISTGVQLVNGDIDKDLFKKIVEWASPMKVTCHRVFDFAPDPFRALEDVIECGCERILTSGQETIALEGAPLLAKLVKAAGDRIIIMPGAGIRASNIEHLIRKSGASEFHASARQKVTNGASLRRSELINLGHIYHVDEMEVRNIISIGNKTLKSR